ncbi:MAG: hypothetical protein H6719_21695 [Sandaracinaceae bacterium]|nr:hypothetical protein [Sandaracinaceae bacterium]
MRLALIAAFLIAALPAAASAQARAVVLAPLSGSGSGPARRALGRALEGRGYTVTLADEAPGDDAAATARLAEEADAGAVVGGSVTHRGPRWAFELWVRDRTGGPQGDVRLRVRGERGIARVAAQVDDALQLVPTAASPVAEAVEPAPAAPTASPAATPAATPARPSRGAERPSSEEPFPVRAELQVGAGLRSRSVELLGPDGVDGAYRAEPYFEIAARGSARFFDVAFVRVRFGSSVALVSDREDPALGEVASQFFRLRGDAGASYWIDDTVELGAAFGVGWDRYELSFNELVPTAEYVHLRPAIVSGVRLIGRELVLDAEVGLRFPLGVGDLTALHGVDYEVMGLDGLLRLHGRVEPGFTWTLEGGARRYWLTFHRPDGEVQGYDGGWQATAYVGWEL